MERAGQEKSSTWDNFRQLLSERTEGKLTLLTEEEAQRIIVSGEPMLTIRVQSADELVTMRNALRTSLGDYGLAPKRLFHYLVAVNEAVTNALLYGKDVNVHILQMIGEPVCRVAVLDGGQGIPLAEIPQAVLVRGYSKRNSLGVGFPVMLHYTDRLWLSTSQSGTVLLLDLDLDMLNAPKVKIQ